MIELAPLTLPRTAHFAQGQPAIHDSTEAALKDLQGEIKPGREMTGLLLRKPDDSWLPRTTAPAPCAGKLQAPSNLPPGSTVFW